MASTHQSTQQIIDAEICELQPILEPIAPELTNNMRTLLGLLHDMQQKSLSAKFHLLMETCVERASRNHTELRVVFSPTINQNDAATEHMILRAASFMGLVSRASESGFVASRPVPAQSTNPASSQQEPTPEHFPPPEQLLQSRAINDMRDLRLFSLPDFPKWFPGKPHVHDPENVIRIPYCTFEKFNLQDKAVAWLYEFFFTQMNFAASTIHPHLKFTGLYTQFTPDWYKGDFSISEGLYFKLGVTQVSQKRNLRNRQGYDKMRLTLSAFHEYEKAFCRKSLEYMLQHMTYLRERFPASQRQMSIDQLRHRRINRTREVIPITPRSVGIDASNNFATRATTGGATSDDKATSQVPPSARPSDAANCSSQPSLLVSMDSTGIEGDHDASSLVAGVQEPENERDVEEDVVMAQQVDEESLPVPRHDFSDDSL